MTAGAVIAGRQVLLDGWHTANAVRYGILNDVIQRQGKMPPSFAEGGFVTGNIAGTWDTWTLVADSATAGGGVLLACKVKAGSGTDGLGNTVDLTGAVVYALITLAKVPDAKTVVNDKTAQKDRSKVAVASLMPDGTPSPVADPVSVQQVMPAALNGQFNTLFADALNRSIGMFDAVFHSVALNEVADVGDFQWLKPVELSYATAATLGGDAILAALCLTEAVDPSVKLPQSVPAVLTQDYPPGSNSVFVIAAEMFTREFLQKGVQKLFPKAAATDFDIVGDGLVMTNTVPVTWFNMVLGDGTQISPVIPAKGLTLQVVQDHLEFRVRGMTYDQPAFVGHNTYEIDFAQTAYLILGRNAAGDRVLIATYRDPADPNAIGVPALRDCMINVTPNQALVVFQEVMDGVAMAASLFGLGAFVAGKWVLSAGAFAATAGEVRTAIASGQAAMSLAMDASQVAVDAVTVADGNLAAAAAFAANGPALELSYAPYMLKFATYAGILDAVLTITSSSLKLQTLADGEIDTSNVPGLDDFLDNVLGASVWPHVKTWDLVDVRLAQSLLIYGNLTL